MSGQPQTTKNGMFAVYIGLYDALSMTTLLRYVPPLVTSRRN